jgi:hypothetical protein
MADFSCTLKINNFPTEVRPGAMIKATAEVADNTAPVRSVIFAVDAYGIRQSFKKESDTTFVLNYLIPYDAPRGNYKVSVWAVSDEGYKSAIQTYQVAAK